MPSHAQQKQLSREKEKKRDNSPSFTWPEYILYEGNNLIFCGSVSKTDTSFIVDKIHEI